MNSGEQLIHRGLVKGLEQGRHEGREEGLRNLRTALVGVFAARQVPLSDGARARIAACTEMEALTAWLTRAATATREADVFGEG